PAQADQLRKNIQLKLTLAQLALSSEDRADLQSNLGEVVASMDRHFDKQAESVVEVLKVLDSLHSYRLEDKES
ncbi:MAG TPA: uroporphyrinogen-III C-methyltransferase, partial [Nitrosomonas sp.]|nr:uroporphyrinogen-III C-methyltransferase [Nitrosomonas sp.]